MYKFGAIVAIALIGFVLWRNYGVIPKGGKLDLSQPTTNEQKELANAVSGEIFNDGDIVKTSFGFYTFEKGDWTKTKEIWE